jgi:D-glycero-D-manno-heptose 1,7-bisphosphate phosphatase
MSCLTEKVTPPCFRGIFLDRDGVINRERGHLRSIEEFELLPGVASGIAELNRRGVKVAVLTNQSGIARGYLTVEELDQIHCHMNDLLSESGAWIDFLAYSPWLNIPDLPGGVGCYLKDHVDRKPNPGMLHNAMNYFGLSSCDVCYVGDSGRDSEAARRAGMIFFGIASSKIEELPKQSEVYPSLEMLVHSLINHQSLPPPLQLGMITKDAFPCIKV